MNAVNVERRASGLGTWTHASWVPDPGSRLASSIERIWYFDGVLDSACERIFPDGTLELIAQLDEPHRPAGGESERPFPALCLTGLRTTAEVVRAPPLRCRVLGVRLSPQGAFAVFRASLAELTGLTLELQAVVGRDARELEDRVRGAAGATEAVRAAAGWAAGRIDCGPAPEETVQRALGAIAADGGTQSIAALRAWEGRSRARFAATFRDRVGVSPKRFARIVRFDRALQALAHNSCSLGEIALAAGYYDQAHFSAEFREHAGLTPNVYRRALRYPGSTHLATADQFFQDAAS